jgi:RNA polymerase sigma-70 factor (ECF subfamily)
MGDQVTTDKSHLLSDHRLVVGAQAGVAGALDELISSVRPRILKYCRSRLMTYAGGLDAADDAAQETCVALVKVLPRFVDQGVPFEAFVFSIAANKVADAQRRFARSAVLVDELPEQTEPSLTPEEQAIAGVDVSAARQLLRLLTPRMRELLMMRAGGESADVVGKHFGMTANAVRVAQCRSTAKLRRYVEASAEHRETFDLYRRRVA